MKEKEVLSLIAEGENERIEFKRELDLESAKDKAKVVKYVVALANSAPGGGYLLIGVDDDKSTPGINRLEEERIQQIAREYIIPPVKLRCFLVPMEASSSPVGVIEVKATCRPHKVRKQMVKLNQDDVFVRRGSVVDKASSEEILEMQEGGTWLLWGVGVIALAALVIAIFSAIRVGEPVATPTPVPIAVSIATPTEAPRIAVVTKESTPTLTPTSTQTSTETPTLTLTPTHTPTPTPKSVAVVKAETLNVRSGPGTEYDVLRQVGQGGELEIVARTGEGDWIQVRLADGNKGWVSVQGVDLSGEMTSIPVAAFIPPTPTPVLPTETPTPSVPLGMVYVPAGEFTMGSSDAEVDYALQLCNEHYGDCQRHWFSGEQPQHTVYLDAFYIDKTEVTTAQYRECVEARACNTPMDITYYNNANYAQHPVGHVDWYQASKYCQWADKRLPTEAEWEKAARGPEGRVFPWGDEFDGTWLNYCDANCEKDWKDASANDGYAETAPVGSYPAGASPYGALDMAGNAWEWVADWYWKDYYIRSPTQNPPGPGSGVEQVLRGGSWDNVPHLVRGSNRSGWPPDHQSPNVGFRCARDAE